VLRHGGDVLGDASSDRPSTAAGGIDDDAETRAPRIRGNHRSPGLILAVVLVVADAEVRGHAIADAPGVGVERRVRTEVRALAALRDRVPLDDRRSVAEKGRIDRRGLARAGNDAARSEDSI